MEIVQDRSAQTLIPIIMTKKLILHSYEGKAIQRNTAVWLSAQGCL